MPKLVKGDRSAKTDPRSRDLLRAMDVINGWFRRIAVTIASAKQETRAHDAKRAMIIPPWMTRSCDSPLVRQAFEDNSTRRV